MDLRYKQLVQCSAEGCVTSHQTHANARKHTQTHANARKHTANTRKHTQTHANTRKHRPQTHANTVQLPKPLFRFNKSSKGDPQKKKIIHKFHS